MKRYRSKQPPEGARLVHNFWPGPADDPGRDRPYGVDGFRYWVTDEPPGSRPPSTFTDVFDMGDGSEHRCYCGWLDGREHYGTRYVDAAGDLHSGDVVRRGGVGPAT